MANRLLDQLLGGTPVSFEEFMAATPQERYQYLTDNQYTRNGTASGARAAAAALRNITAEPGQIMAALQSSGLDPSFANEVGGQLGGIITAQQQDNGDWFTKNGWILPAAMVGGGMLAAGAGAGAGAEVAGIGGGGGGLGGGGLAAGDAALGTGLKIGAGGITGLTPGVASTAIGGEALGTGIGAGTAAGTAGTALAPGFFAGESLYPVAGGAAAAMGGGAGGGSSLGSIAGAGLTAADLVRGIPGLLGAAAASKQADQYGALADRYFDMGAPYRGRLAELYNDPTSFLRSPEVTIPIQQGTDMTARALSTSGNPTGSGNALQAIQSYASGQLFGRLGQEKDRLAGFGGLSNYNAAAPGAANNEIGAQGNVLNGIGAAANDIFNPPKSLAQILREARIGGY